MTDTKNTQNKKTTEQQNKQVALEATPKKITRAALIKTAREDLKAYEEASQKQHDTWCKLFLGLRAIARADKTKTKKNDMEAIIKKHCKQALSDVYGTKWVKANKTRASEYNKILCYVYTMEDEKAKKFFEDNNQKTALDLARGKKRTASRSDFSKARTYATSLGKINIDSITPSEARELLQILSVVYNRLDEKVEANKNLYGANKQAANQ